MYPLAPVPCEHVGREGGIGTEGGWGCTAGGAGKRQIKSCTSATGHHTPLTPSPGCHGGANTNPGARRKTSVATDAVWYEFHAILIAHGDHCNLA